MASIQAKSISTRTFKLGEDLASFIQEHLPVGAIGEKQILCVTSKIVSLAEKAIVERRGVTSKMELVKAESDHVLAGSSYGTALTIKHNILIPAAGIDESNAAGDYYILLPKDPYASAYALHRKLKELYGLKEFGLVLTDSHTHPLRKGVTGIGLAHEGFRASKSMIGQKDLYGRPLAMTQINVLDSVSVAAVYVMGEASESCPLALVDADSVEFCGKSDASEIRVPVRDDLYFPLLAHGLEGA